MKTFLICSVDNDIAKIEIRNLVLQFIDKMFQKQSDFDINEISIEISDLDVYSPELELQIDIYFNEYTYINGLDEECTESLMMVLENKWRQPFYIDGKFEAKSIYEWVSGGPIQKNEKIYGVDKEYLYNSFEDSILTC